MTVPDSFCAWENQESRRYCNHVENYLLPLEDKLAELKEKLERGTLTDEEDFLLFALEEAGADGDLDRLEMEATFEKVDRANDSDAFRGLLTEGMQELGVTEVEELLLDWLYSFLTVEEQDRLLGWH